MARSPRGRAGQKLNFAAKSGKIAHVFTASRPISTDCVSVSGISFSHADIFRVVDGFYRSVAVDDLLKVPFGSVHDWPHHIEKMTHFWWFRFGGKRYLDEQYDPVTKHYHAGFNTTFLERWLKLFHSTLGANLQPTQAQLWTDFSNRMGQALLAKNEMLKSYLAEQQTEE